jgi:hypothetical protein
LSDSDLKTLSGDQAITSANRNRTTVENYLKEMNVPAEYADLMFSVPKDKVRWIGKEKFEADLEGVIPGLKDWLAARCDKRTDIEKAVRLTRAPLDNIRRLKGQFGKCCVRRCRRRTTAS